MGQFASLRADNPATFISSVAAVLADYPPGVVMDCIDPRTGLASKVEFLSIKSLGEWLKVRLEYYEALAGYWPKPVVEAVETPPTEVASRALRKLFNWLKTPQKDRGAPPTWREAAQEVAGEKRS